MALNIKIFLLVLLSVNKFVYTRSLKVNFEYLNPVKINENDDSTISKRDMTQFFDQASYSFNGFQKVESVPVMFPIDICIMELDNIKYAASLHKNKNGDNSLEIFRENGGNFETITDITLPNAIALDCKNFGPNGYVAIARNITETIRNARDGSPIYEISPNGIRSVQYFPSENLRSVFLRVSGNDLYLLQAFENTKSTPNLICPYFKWSGTTFNKLGGIPCSNAHHLEPFSIHYESYVAVANYADQFGRTNIYSEIYKFNRQSQKFQLFQKIKTNGAVDVQHFRVPVNAARNKHFLVFGNSKSDRLDVKPGDQLEADSVFYVFEKGQFVPYQSISLYAVEKFLPIENLDAEKFLLLVACANQDIKIYNLNDWKFEVSNVQYTEGALGEGVAEMRIYEENDNNYLVIANENMADSETNVFLPIFKQEEHANALRQEIINWAKENIERIKSLDTDKLKSDVEKKLSTMKTKAFDNIEEIQEATINTVWTKSLIYPQYHFNSDYWQALKYSKQALDVLEELYPLRQQRDVSENPSMDSDSIDEKMEWNYDEMRVKNFKIRELLKVKRVNGIDVEEPQFEQIKAKKIMVTGTYLEPKHRSIMEEIRTEEILNIENLQLNGSLNGYKWEDLLNDTLKREGLQVIKAPASFESLQTETVLAQKEEISGQNLKKLVSIRHGSYVINQDIQFATPVKARNLLIHNRLNNINVHNLQFDVLLKRSPQIQTIEGPKNFENIKVLEPITLSGKVAGQHLRSMVPAKAIHDPLILKGNYSIENTVTIGKVLNVSDIILEEDNLSLLEVLENGLRLDTILEDVNLAFKATLSANNSEISFINGVNMQDLIRTNTSELQIVEGEKIFSNSLEIGKGFAEVKNLNGVDIDNLQERLLLKDTNQTIKVAMHLGGVIAKGLESRNLSLNGKSLDNFLTISTDQVISGRLKVKELIVSELRANNLNTNGQVFGANLHDIYQQKAKNTPHRNLFQKGQKFNGTVYIRNLYLNSSLNGRQVQEIEKQLGQLEGNIKYVGNFLFNYPMNITNLVFEGSLNGISKQHFGKCWLQKVGAQSFTVPQTLAGVNAEKPVQLHGKLNNMEIEDLKTKTYSLDRTENLGNIVFYNPIEVQGSLNTRTLNDLSVPEDILSKNSVQPQIMRGILKISKDLTVKHTLKNVEWINGMPIRDLNSYLEGFLSDTLHLNEANFTFTPRYVTLNHYNLERCLNEVWLTNENINFRNHLEISEAHFEGLLDFKGPINNMNLKYLEENYLSLSKPQDVTTELVFTKATTFEDQVIGKNMYLYGPIGVPNSVNQIDFNDFVAKTLKTSGNHIISGEWSLNQAHVYGNLHNVRINDINLANDVLRNDIPLNEISIPKHLSQAKVKRLYATPGSKINNVDISKWIKETVFLYENRTIWGSTSIDTINLFDDLQASKINNESLEDINKLMQRDSDQIIEGNIIIENFIPLEKRFLTNNIENLNIKAINNQPIETMIRNMALKNSSLDIKGYLEFLKPVYVSSIESNQDIIAFKKLKRSHPEDILMSQRLHDSPIYGVSYALDHFEIISVPLNHVSIEKFFSNDQGEMFLRTNSTYGVGKNDYLYWNWSKGIFEEMKVPNSIFEFNLEDPHEFAIYSKFYPILHAELDEKKNTSIVQLNEKDCIVSFGKNVSSVDFHCLEQNATSKEILGLELYKQIPRKGVEHVIVMNNNTLALIYKSKVEIWNLNEMNVHQSILLNKTISKVQYIEYDSNFYLVIILEEEMREVGKPLSSIHLYKSSIESLDLESIQSFSLEGFVKVAFSRNFLSEDLFLHIVQLKENHSILYTIYEYNGAMGFVSISEILLPSMDIHDVGFVFKKDSDQDLIVLVGKKQLAFVQSFVRET